MSNRAPKLLRLLKELVIRNVRTEKSDFERGWTLRGTWIGGQNKIFKEGAKIFSTLCADNKYIWPSSGHSKDMFPSDEFWRNVVFFAIGGIIAVLTLKLREAETREQRRRQVYLDKESRNRPQENDERYC